jgi:CopG family transcriptional regulator/antitoxin EndoAI
MDDIERTIKVLVAFRKEMLKEIDDLAKAEHRNRSDLIREAVRIYIKTNSQKK